MPRPDPRLLAALVLGAAFLALDPARTLSGEAALRATQGLGVAALVGAACLGAGRALLGHRGPLPWPSALGAGYALLGAGQTALAFTGLAGRGTAAALVVLLALGWVRPGSLTRPRLPLVGALGLLVLLGAGALHALAPPTDTDELYYQLAIPRFITETGGLAGGFLHPDMSRPSPVQAAAAALYALGGETAPRLFHLGLTVALVLGARELAAARFGEGAGDLGAAALAGSYTVASTAGFAYADVPAGLFLLLAADAALDRRAPATGLWAGLAVAAKYTAGPAALAVCLVAAWELRRHPGVVLAAAALALLPLLPWWARNAATGLHPLFPFAGWPAADAFRFVYPEKYGAGRDLLATALLPWNLLMRAETDSFVFLGRLNLAWAGLGVGTLLALRREPLARRLAFVVALGFAAWAASAQLLRYLVPLLAVAAYASGAARAGRATWLLFALSLPANLVPLWSRAADVAAAARGAEARDAYLARALPAWPAVAYVRDHVPPDEPVALLNTWAAYLVPQPTLLGSVEDHVPTRHWVFTHGDASLAALYEAGARWLLVGDIKYLRKGYGFLDEATWKTQLREPQERLERLLLRDADRVFADRHHAVWRLRPPLDDPTPGP